MSKVDLSVLENLNSNDFIVVFFYIGLLFGWVRRPIFMSMSVTRVSAVNSSVGTTIALCVVTNVVCVVFVKGVGDSGGVGSWFLLGFQLVGDC